jgi:hypothetical protein
VARVVVSFSSSWVISNLLVVLLRVAAGATMPEAAQEPVEERSIFDLWPSTPVFPYPALAD